MQPDPEVRQRLRRRTAISDLAELGIPAPPSFAALLAERLDPTPQPLDVVTNSGVGDVERAHRTRRPAPGPAGCARPNSPTPSERTPMDTETINFDEIEQEHQAKLAALDERRQSLSLDAVTDDAKREELDDVESQMRVTQTHLERITAARQEHDRRETERLAEAERQRKRDALQKANDLNPARQKVAVKVDQAMAALVKSIQDYSDLAHKQQALMLDGGRTFAAQVTLEPYMVEQAFAHALRDSSDEVRHATSDWRPGLMGADSWCSLADWNRKLHLQSAIDDPEAA